MSKKGNGFFGGLLLLIRLIFTTALTLAVFILLLGFVAFRCLYPAGSEMLAATLSSYPVVEILPRIYFSSSELDRIIADQAAGKETADVQSEQTDADTEKPVMLLSQTAQSAVQPSMAGDDLFLLDGLYVVNNPVSIPPSSASTPAPAEAEEDIPTVLYGCVNGTVTTYLRLTPSLEARKVLTIEPGTWCTVLSEEKHFYKIFYENAEYYIYNDRLDVYEVPELSEGLTIPGLPEATLEEIEKMLSGETEQTAEPDNRIMCGFVDAITPYRNAPSFTEAQTGFLEANTHFKILEETDSFYKISVDGHECYVYSAKVTVYYEDTPAATLQEAQPLPVETADPQA